MGLEDARQTFELETGELLEKMESGLLHLESSPQDTEILNGIFRTAHTIKGSSGLVGFDNIERFTHSMENVLDMMRQGDIAVSSDLIELLLECRDHITQLVRLGLQDIAVDEDVRMIEKSLLTQLDAYMGPSEEPPPKQKEEPETYTDEISESSVESDNWHISLRFGHDVFRNGMDPIAFISYLQKLGEILSITTIADAMPPADQMDPETCYLGFEIDMQSEFAKKDIEEVFEFVQEDCKVRILPPKSVIESYIHLISELPEDPMKIGEILVKGGALTPIELLNALQQQGIEKKVKSRPIGEILTSEGMIEPKVLDAAIEKQKEAKDTKIKESRSIRVDTDKLDALINLVGEMVIADANINQHAQRIRDRDLNASVSGMSRLIEEIRDRAMEVRMVPVHDTFNSFHRVVRDICHGGDKEIDLVITGDETEIDRNVIEKIKDPLMHLVRNAADHGIEDTDERITGGKTPRGTIRLNAYQETGDVVLEIIDDGRGLDRDKILERAVERELVDRETSLTDTETFDLISQAGFSTADKVTNVSGRGVGMDVVKRSIEALRGTVRIESEEGEGTTIRLRLPLTLAIIDGFLVGIGDESYVIPLDMVVECIELTEADRKSSHGRNYVNLRGTVLPYIRLREYFNMAGHDGDALENIVVVHYGEKQAGLVVERLFGGVQAVIKSLGKLYDNVKGISGATILGDGTVALILDVANLAQHAEDEERSHLEDGRA
jgi:two-component system chemotaxis sensor kinase CheA